MRKIFFVILLILLISVNFLAQDFKEITDGIEYAEITRGTEKEPIRLNLLRLDLTKVRLDVVHALDAGVGVEKTSSIATRHGAIAAINAGFFKMEGVYKGDAAGILQVDGKLLSESYGNRIALGVFNESARTNVVFDYVNSAIYGAYAGDGEFLIDGTNRQRNPKEAILYTPVFHRTTLTDSGGTEIILADCDKIYCKSVKVVEGCGSTLIPNSGFVISIGSEALGRFAGLISFLKKPSRRKKAISFHPYIARGADFSDISISKAEDIVAGVPQLIKNGKIEITWEQEKIGKSFVETKHPRTAVAKLKDGKFLMITVDGRQPEHSIGMNLNELAQLLLELGATEAMNLDGGGSTTMFLDGKVMNKPSDKTGEREVSDAILVFPRKSQHKER